MTKLQARLHIRLRNDIQLIQLILVGCGGNGSHLAEALARITYLLRQQGKLVTLAFVDFDHVEPGNIPRQNFCTAELGLNKAEALAFRYSSKWGVDIQAVPEAFNRDRWQYYNALTLLLGCTDNQPGARASLYETLTHNPEQQSPNVWWLDLGNGTDSGQVILGSATDLPRLATAFALQSTCIATPCAGWLHPELLLPSTAKAEADTKPPSQTGMSCRELALTHEQMPAVNQMTAAIAAGMLTKLLVTQDLTYWASYFNLHTGTQTSLDATPAVVEQVLLRLKGR